MMNTVAIEDLWPIDIIANVVNQTPLKILREQATKLNEKTRNVIEADVFTEPRHLGFECKFVIKAPILGGYEHELFAMEQPVDLYPVVFEYPHQYKLTRDKANTEEELKEMLAEIFKSDYTRKIIGNLLALSTSP